MQIEQHVTYKHQNCSSAHFSSSSYTAVVHCGSLELDLLIASVGASEDHVSGLRAEGVLAVLEQAISVGSDDSGEEVEG
jgi:hypothetical protein